MKKYQTTQKIKSKARKGLNRFFSKKLEKYVIDTNVVINQSLGKLIRRGLKGKIIIPNAVMAELENLANKGNEAGFKGLDEIAKLHHLKNHFQFSVFFEGLRPTEHQIKFAKSGEIDAAIREIARKNHAILVTSDLVQAKTAEAYNIPILFIKTKTVEKPEKKQFFLFRRKPKNKF